MIRFLDALAYTEHYVPAGRSESCPACEAEIPTKTMSIGTLIPSDPSAPKVKPDIVRKGPGGVYAYIRQRDKGKISYQVVLLSMVQLNYTLAGVRGAPVQIGASDYLGHVFKRGTKFCPMLPDGRVRRKGSSSLKKATHWLYAHRRG